MNAIGIRTIEQTNFILFIQIMIALDMDFNQQIKFLMFWVWIGKNVEHEIHTNVKKLTLQLVFGSETNDFLLEYSEIKNLFPFVLTFHTDNSRYFVIQLWF